MAYYKPCKNCAVDTATCPRRTEITKAISGLCVTVINFQCGDRQSLFHTGQRVKFNWISWEPDYEYGEPPGVRLVYHGTVIEDRRLRFIVRVDDGPSADDQKIFARDVFKSDNLVIKVKPSDMKALDEPDRQLCPSCSAYPDEDNRCQGWGTPGSWDGYWPAGCLVRQSRQTETDKAKAEAVF